MNKTAVKIIKRKDTIETANIKKLNLFEQKRSTKMSNEKIKSRSRRNVAETVSKWVAEWRKNKRSDEISAVRKLFGGEQLLSKTA